MGLAYVDGVSHASLWSGSAGSWVDLNPVGATTSQAFGVSGGQQVGSCDVGGITRASLWSGSAGSWVDLSPVGATESEARAVMVGIQVGTAKVGGYSRASLWSGSAASWVDLHAYLSPIYTGSRATGIYKVGNITYVVGLGLNMLTGGEEALLWVSGRPTLGIRSANPATGVPMTVWTTDVNGRANGTTSFDRIYNAGTNASVTAPLNVGTQWFEHWEKDSIPAIGSRTITVLMDASHTIKAVYKARRTLTVTSQNPNSGVPIAVWTVDKSGQSNGSTQFSRVYSEGTSVSLTAPAIVGNSAFRRWDLNGAPWQATRTVTLPMSADRSLTAVYVAGEVLTVSSAKPNVPVTVWSADLAGLRDGSTNFTRLYLTGSVVSLTAPAAFAGKPFVRWEKNGLPVPGIGRTVSVTMNGAQTLNVVYAP